ncbi:MAG: MATE family efflux transporter [Muribaculaceae bacterium]|nr:MATE family efflux transporter [Muribaculaceae bacterium]
MHANTATGLDYANGKISTLFRKIFFPTLLGMIFTALITIVDGIFVGNGVGPDGIAAVNIIAPLYMVATGIGLMLGIGASVLAGMALAENERKRACAIVSQAFLTGTCIMAVIVALTLLFPTQIARLLGSSDHLMPLALDYLCWLMPGILFLVWSSIGMMTIRLDGSPNYAMLINVIPAILNIIGDYVLIFPCGMGVKGAAIATAGSVAIGGVMAIIYFRKSYVIKLVADYADFRRNLLKTMAVGSASFITEIAMSIMMLTGNIIFMRYFGDAGVAAYSIACYLFPLMFMMSNAVAQSAQPIISYNFGNHASGRVSAAFRMSLRVALLCGAIVTVSIFFLSGEIVGLFIPVDSEAGLIAVHGLPIYSFCATFFALNIAYIGYYQSMGKAARAMTYTLLRGVIILVPLFFLLPSLFPSWGMWAAIPASELCTFLIIFSRR